MTTGDGVMGRTGRRAPGRITSSRDRHQGGGQEDDGKWQEDQGADGSNLTLRFDSCGGQEGSSGVLQLEVDQRSYAMMLHPHAKC